MRGFAVKFYTQEGNWDLVGNNIPVFFIQDAIKFPDLIHAVKMEADRGYPQAGSAHDTFWDWASLMPETTHMLMWAMSDRAIPRSLRMMEGFGNHTFRLVNAEGTSTFVKFHWKPKLGMQSTLWDEAMKLQAADNDYHRRDLHEAIESGAFPEWELGIQAFDQKFANSLPYDVLDATKIIPEEVLPVRLIGRMVLDRNVDNFFAETERVAYCPANIVPGIDFTNDPLLQGRLFSYLDTQKSRLGTSNFHQLPINAPKCPVMNFQRDGQMQMNVPKGRASYEPNSLGEAGEETGPRECPVTGFTTFGHQAAEDAQGDKLPRFRPELFADHYSQARLLFRSLTENERAYVALVLHLRAFEGRTSPCATADRWQFAQCRRGSSQAGGGRHRHSAAAKEPGNARADRPQPEPRAQHPGQHERNYRGTRYRYSLCRWLRCEGDQEAGGRGQEARRQVGPRFTQSRGRNLDRRLEA